MEPPAFRQIEIPPTITGTSPIRFLRHFFAPAVGYGNRGAHKILYFPLRHTIPFNGRFDLLPYQPYPAIFLQRSQLSPAAHIVHLESGSYLVYGFCFEPEILFGQHTDIHPFFQPVLKARRAVYQHLVTSMDFRAEKNTRDKILELQQKLSLGKESSAFSILMTLKDLFALSIRKIQIEYEHNQVSRLLVDLARSN
ncbi:hypothetical protein [Sphingobacterium sp. DR205]|uniref:hypothetical protein n=1 Tax=Sphingobacterium sp. DR205 TaxID=2713573 RepID=UPI0013E4FE1C|nr:hypothetical protein [Sphingobacterium sp. DR205]QIH34960.1 hypothetical protein G6053_19580 [Sphingobacterium sp. DR205]